MMMEGMIRRVDIHPKVVKFRIGIAQTIINRGFF